MKFDSKGTIHMKILLYLKNFYNEYKTLNSQKINIIINYNNSLNKLMQPSGLFIESDSINFKNNECVICLFTFWNREISIWCKKILKSQRGMDGEIK